MKYVIYLLYFLALVNLTSLKAENNLVNLDNKYSGIVKKIIDEAMKDSSAWERLAYMCDTFGPRLSGSHNLENALNWIVDEMKKDGLENIQRDEVMVPVWIRGNESCSLISPRKAKMNFMSYGGSIATPKEGITASVLVVNSFEDLQKKAKDAKGKIVVYNVPFVNYGQAVQFRWLGHLKAAEVGAVASLVRSVSPIGFQLPHTGSFAEYVDSIPKIPHGAITLEDAEMLQRMQNRGQNPVIYLYLEARTEPDKLSYNVMGEVKGSVYPDEIIAIGGHIDSWDAGTGAHDDAGGCIATWEAVKLIKKLGLKPRRTIRAVMWANEENGARGGKVYAEKHKHEKHHLMFEFDAGIFPPKSIGFRGPDSLFEIVNTFQPFITQVEPSFNFYKGGWGVDIDPMFKLGVPAMTFNTNDSGKYFWYHHADSDTPDKIDPKDLNKCIAAIAIAVFLYADL
ncbi:MAG: M20/M25/M40 family metallo-hydrolase [Candidatus Kapabacteria bacterium]|nr:M20/M25/M40 family metallo-hydrolase [Candidatus Kapabacteria bacterium]